MSLVDRLQEILDGEYWGYLSDEKMDAIREAITIVERRMSKREDAAMLIGALRAKCIGCEYGWPIIGGDRGSEHDDHGERDDCGLTIEERACLRLLTDIVEQSE